MILLFAKCFILDANLQNMHRLSAILDMMAAILNILMSYIAGKIAFIIPCYDLAIRNMLHFR